MQVECDKLIMYIIRMQRRLLIQLVRARKRARRARAPVAPLSSRPKGAAANSLRLRIGFRPGDQPTSEPRRLGARLALTGPASGGGGGREGRRSVLAPPALDPDAESNLQVEARTRAGEVARGTA